MFNDQELSLLKMYDKRIAYYHNFLGTVFGMGFITISVTCLQFGSPEKAALIYLPLFLSLYFAAFFENPLRAIKKYSGTCDNKAFKLKHESLERENHGWIAFFKVAPLWFGLLFYCFLLLGNLFPYIEGCIESIGLIIQ